jgi:hypothetical protein
MRLWSLHPSLLDQKGLVALWRETLLAKAVLENKTKGYKNHPQLNRFKKQPLPLDEINNYLSHIHQEAERRGYKFDCKKLSPINVEFINQKKIGVSLAQIDFEWKHLLNKVKVRDINWFNLIKDKQPYPIDDFEVYKSDQLEEWERGNI